MWEINNTLQIISFFRAVGLGSLFSALYDFLRALRKAGSFDTLSVFFQDLIYFLFLSPVTFLFLLAVTNGELRAFVFIGIILGFLIYRLTLSKLFLKVFISIYKLFFMISKIIIDGFYRFFDAVFSFFSEFFSNIVKFIKKICICMKKVLKKK